MKRKLLTLTAIAALSASLVTGCGSKAETEATTAMQTAAEATTEAALEIETPAPDTTAAEVTEAEITETVTEEVTSDAEQDNAEYYITLNVHTTGTVKITSDDGAGGKLVDETMGYGFSVSAGETLRESMKKFGILDIELVPDDDKFEGWMEYRDIMEVDETDGYEYLVSYEKVSDDLYTTEEILDMTLDAHTTFIAKWESIPYDEYYLNYEYVEDGLDLDVTIYGNGGLMNYSGSYAYESDLTAATFDNDVALGAFLGDSGHLESVEREGYTFNGWCVYASDEIEYVVGLDTALSAGNFCVDLEQYGFAVMDEWEIIFENATTEELYDIVCDGRSYLAVANWIENNGEKELLLCSGCEVTKPCGIYAVDGQKYIVCDDCYNEFATAFDLK